MMGISPTATMTAPSREAAAGALFASGFTGTDEEIAWLKERLAAMSAK